jgi:precorrin-6B methylase 2
MNFIITLIKYGLGDCENKDIIYAVEHIKPVLKVIEVEKQEDFSEEIDITLLISIIQEIIYVHKEKVKIEVDTVGYKTNKKSMDKLLVQGYEKQPAILRIAWENRINNRVLINFNLGEHIIEARKIENTIYKIKREVFSYINIEDIKLLTATITSAYKVIEESKCDDVVIELMKERVRNLSTC